MMNLPAFYAASRVTALFGYSPQYDGFHYGVDFAHPSGTPIPTPWTIEVVRAGWQEGHGWFVSGRRADGFHASFSHMLKQPTVGGVIPKGGIVGPLGSTGLSDGPHTHVQLSRSSMPWVHGTEIDPWPQIAAALADTAGGGTRPITDTRGADDMPTIYEDAGPNGENTGKGTLYVGGPGVWKQWPPMKYPNDRAILAQAFGPVEAFLTRDLAAVREACLLAAPPTSGTVTVDEEALAAALAPLLGGVTDKDLAAAVQQMKAAIPTTFKAS